MEKKTIGAFIAVLRKAAGMTQRELAERLNVSDKSVSRWERDECAPDLSLIPVIAEIFDVTTDELLRGERKAAVNEPAETAEETSAYIREKSTKQFQNLLRIQQMRLKERSLITLGVTIGGYLTAMICNFAFLKSLLGFFLATAFYAAAVILEICFLRRSAVAEDDAFDLGKWLTYQNESVKTGTKYFFLVLVFFGATLPLLLLGGSHYGLEVGSYLILALLSTAVFSLLGILIYALAVKPYLIKKGALFLTEAEKEIQRKKHRLLKKTTIASACIAMVFIIAAAIISEIVPLFAERIRFDDYESFKEYIENPSIGNVHDDFLIETIKDADGNILCEYQWKNDEVVQFDASFDKNEDGLPIYVTTRSARIAAYNLADNLSALCCVIAVLQALIAMGIYITKARKYR